MKKVRSGYFDQKNVPRLRRSYCVYMDIVGFKDISSYAYKRQQGDHLLANLHKIISLQAEELIPKPDSLLTSSSYAKQFTDNIVLGEIIESDDGEIEFGVVLSQVMYYQLSMALEGYFVRGGISVGDLFIDDKIVIGPALLKAHSIEESMARDPRVVLSTDVYKLIRKHIKYGNYPLTTRK